MPLPSVAGAKSPNRISRQELGDQSAEIIRKEDALAFVPVVVAFPPMTM
jgi:hypothetical protein